LHKTKREREKRKMLFKSSYPDIPIPETNIVHRLFPPGKPVSDTPHWIDAANPDHYLSPAQALLWARRLGAGLDHLGVPEGGRVLLVSPNHIFVPVVYLGVVGSKRAFRWGIHYLNHISKMVVVLLILQ
jgi:4-coumarate--CoA ligase